MKWMVWMAARVYSSCYVEVDAENMAEAKEKAVTLACNGQADWECSGVPSREEIFRLDAESK